MRSLLVTFATLLALAAGSSPTPAAPVGVPDPRSSTVPTYLQMCPAGDLTQGVIVHDVNNSPLVNVVVELDFCACPGIMLCPAMAGDPYTIVSGCRVQALTNGSGIASFPIRGGGVCAGPVPVSASGVLLASPGWTVSPDQDGNGIVDAVDSGILATKLGGGDRTGDLNGDGVVDAADSAILAAHAGHACANRTPARGLTWGLLKETYR